MQAKVYQISNTSNFLQRCHCFLGTRGTDFLPLSASFYEYVLVTKRETLCIQRPTDPVCEPCSAVMTHPQPGFSTIGKVNTQNVLLNVLLQYDYYIQNPICVAPLPYVKVLMAVINGDGLIRKSWQMHFYYNAHVLVAPNRKRNGTNRTR